MLARTTPKLGFGPRAFNLIFPVVLLVSAALAGAGCADSDKKERQKHAAAIRFHPEVVGEGTGGLPISVLRASPVNLRVENDSVADERDIASARLDESLGGFAITVEFTTHGRMLMEMGTVSRLGLRLGVLAKWMVYEKYKEDGKEKERKTSFTRWLAAPVINQAINGSFTFAPDCTREEAKRIVRGLNDVAILMENQPKPAKSPSPKATGDDIDVYKEAR